MKMSKIWLLLFLILPLLFSVGVVLADRDEYEGEQGFFPVGSVQTLCW
jgi:hypothetical protein